MIQIRDKHLDPETAIAYNLIAAKIIEVPESDTEQWRLYPF